MPVPTRFRLQLLGPFGLFGPDGRRIDVTSKKARALLALLAMSRGGARSRAWLQAMLWGSRDQLRAQSSLRRELSSLKKLAPPLILADHDRIGVALELLDVDVAARGPSDRDCGDFLEGLDLAGEEQFEDWLRVQRAETNAEPTVGPAPSGSQGAAPSLPTKPSIAVLPFANLHRSDDGDHIADGMVEEISIALSRFSSLFVIAGGSSLSYRGDPRDRGVIARELGVRYLLEGSVRLLADTVRIAVKLTDGIENVQIWADRFEDRAENVFDLQDRVAADVALLIDSNIEKQEMRRAIARPVSTPDAHHFYWRANALFRNWDQPSLLEAIQLTERIIELEPTNAWAPALGGFCHGACLSSGWSADPAASHAKALELYERAMRLGGDDPQVLGYAAGTLTIIAGDINRASRHIERALAIHPGSASLLFWAGWVDIAKGEAGRGMERFEAALRLNPRSAVRPFSNTGIGLALLTLRRFAEASAVLSDAIHQIPFYPPTLAALCASLALQGELDEAYTYYCRLQALGGGQGILRIIRDPNAAAIIASGLQQASQQSGLR